MATITLPNGAKVTLPDRTPVPAKPDPTFLGETSRVMSAVNEDYLAPTLGAPVDAVNWLLGGVGLGSEKPFMGSDWLKDQSRDIGASNELRPETQIGKYVAAGLGGAGSAMIGAPLLGGGLMATGNAIGSPATVAAGRAAMATPLADAAAGAGAGAGQQAASDLFPNSSLAQFGGAVLGGIIPGAASTIAKTATNPTLRAMKNLGIDPTMGTAGVGGKTAAYAQNNTLAQSLGGSGVVGDAIGSTLVQTDNALERIAAQYGQPLPGQFEAGQQIQKNLEGWFDRVKQASGKTYEAIAQQFRRDEVFPAANTINALKNPAGKLDNADLAKLISDPEIAKFLSAVEKGGGNLSYNDMKLFRSHVGELLDPRAISNVNNAQMKKLYAALSEDLGAAVSTRGPKTYHKWQTTNAFYKDSLAKFKDQFERMVGRGDARVSGEKAYEALVNAGSRDWERFRETWRVLTPGQRGDLSATVLTQMGRDPKTGGFSVARFLTDYGKLSGHAKALLFRSTGNGKVEEALDDLLTVLHSLDANVNKVESTSRSGAAAIQGSQLVGAGTLALQGTPGGIAAAIGALGGPWAAAKLMTNPAATRGLAWALRAMKAGGKAATKAATLLQSFSVPATEESQ